MAVTREVMAVMLPVTVELYGGRIIGNAEDVVFVEFRNLCDAALYINAYLIADRARIQSDGNGVSQTEFDKPVVIDFNIGELV